jgi:hypothetical protein
MAPADAPSPASAAVRTGIAPAPRGISAGPQGQRRVGENPQPSRHAVHLGRGAAAADSNPLRGGRRLVEVAPRLDRRPAERLQLTVQQSGGDSGTGQTGGEVVLEVEDDLLAPYGHVNLPYGVCVNQAVFAVAGIGSKELGILLLWVLLIAAVVFVVRALRRR